MKNSYKVGLNFGMASGVITTLGLLVGLYAGTGSRLAVIGGIITIALADAFSDALGIHISEEAQKVRSKSVWQSTYATFFSKFLIALTFLIPVWVFNLGLAVFVSVVWGLFLLGFLSYRISLGRGVSAFGVMVEHWVIGAVVIVVTYFVGEGVARLFG